MSARGPGALILVAALGALTPVPTGALTLSQAIETARHASHRREEAAALERASVAAEALARSTRLPRADLGAGYTRLSGADELAVTFPGGTREVLFPDIRDTYRSRVGAVFPIDASGRLAAAIAATAHDARAASQDAVAVDLDLVLAVSAAYWSLALARESERVIEASLGAFEAHLRDAEARERLGLSARHEVLAVRVERDRAALDGARARSLAATAQDALCRLLGLSLGTDVVLEDSLQGPPPAAPVPSGQDLVARSRAARPERAAAASRLDAAEERLRAERRARWPDLALAAGYDLALPNRRYQPPREEWDGSWDLGVSVTLQLYDGGRASAAIARAEALRDAATARLADLDGLLEADVLARRREVDVASVAVEVTSASIEAAREALRVATDRHREGLLPSSERLDAEVSLLRAELEQRRASAELRLAVARLSRTLGAAP